MFKNRSGIAFHISDVNEKACAMISLPIDGLSFLLGQLLALVQSNDRNA